MKPLAACAALALAGCAAHPVRHGCVVEQLPAPAPVVRIVTAPRPVIPMQDRTCYGPPRKPWGLTPAGLGAYIASLQIVADDCRRHLSDVVKLESK